MVPTVGFALTRARAVRGPCERWPTCLGNRQHSAAKFDRLQSVCSGYSVRDRDYQIKRCLSAAGRP